MTRAADKGLASVPAHSKRSGTPSFFHSGDVLRMLVRAVTVQRRTDAQEKFKGVTEIVAIIAIESVGAVVDGELGPELDLVPAVSAIRAIRAPKLSECNGRPTCGYSSVNGQT